MPKRLLLKLLSAFTSALIISACAKNQQINLQPNNEVIKPLKTFSADLSAETTQYPILTYLKAHPQGSDYFQLPTKTPASTAAYQWLSAHVIALKISGPESGSSLNERATGVILAKASTSSADHKYYVATNLHVVNQLMKDQTYNVSIGVNPWMVIKDQDQVQWADFGDPTKISFPNNEHNYLALGNWQISDDDLWVANNIQVNEYDTVSENQATGSYQLVNNPSGFSNTSFTNNKAKAENVKTAKFAADLAIMKLDFDKLVNDKTSMPDSHWDRYKQLFLKDVANKDVTFDQTTNSAGYLMGFSGGHQDKNNSGMIFLQTKPVDNNLLLGRLYLDKSSHDQTLSYDNVPYYVPVANYAFNQLNLFPGASGSAFVHYDDKTHQVNLNGIYWGVTSTQAPSAGNLPPLYQATGNITKFYLANNYDLIGFSHDDKTPKMNSFCIFVKTQKSKQSDLRSPTFCGQS